MGRRLLLAALLVSLLAGCGFKLRTLALDESVESVYIAGDSLEVGGRGEIASDLRTAFTQSGATLTASAAPADLVIQILDERQERRSLSVTGQARAAEWEITRRVLFAAARQDAGSLVSIIEPRWVQVQRFFRVDRNNIVGSNEEQALIERELKTDLIQQILRSVNQVLAATAAEDADAAASPAASESG